MCFNGGRGSPVRNGSQRRPGLAAGRRRRGNRESLGQAEGAGRAAQAEGAKPRLLLAPPPPRGNFPTSAGGASQDSRSPRRWDPVGRRRRGRGGAWRAGAGPHPRATAGRARLSRGHRAGSHSGGRVQVTCGSGRGARARGACGGRAGGRARRFPAPPQCAEGGLVPTRPRPRGCSARPRAAARARTPAGVSIDAQGSEPRLWGTFESHKAGWEIQGARGEGAPGAGAQPQRWE